MMTDYVLIESVVLGGFGELTEMIDPRTRPPSIARLHYELAEWTGDELFESVSTYVVTARLADFLSSRGYEGLTFDDVLVTLSPEAELSPLADMALPPFRWMKVSGAAAEGDIGLGRAGDLVVASQVWDDISANATLPNAEVSPWEGDDALSRRRRAALGLD